MVKSKVMGMYTEFIIECKLKEETPIEIIKCVEDMIDGIENDKFTYFRNPLIDYCGSNSRTFEDFILKAHGEIKNYEKDIQRFVEFITPYVEEGFLEEGAFAQSKYEGYDDWDFYYIFRN